MKRRPRIDAVLGEPASATDYEEYKRLVGLAAERHGAGDPEGHFRAALAARDVALLLVRAVRAHPPNANLPEEQVYRYLANRAHHDMLGPIAKADDVKLFELGVRFPSGRPPTARSRVRQQLLDEISRRPAMPDWRIADRALELGVWTGDQANDPENRDKRIRRLRRDAAK